jgi:hypothetical protein
MTAVLLLLLCRYGVVISAISYFLRVIFVLLFENMRKENNNNATLLSFWLLKKKVALGWDVSSVNENL